VTLDPASQFLLTEKEQTTQALPSTDAVQKRASQRDQNKFSKLAFGKFLVRIFVRSSDIPVLISPSGTQFCHDRFISRLTIHCHVAWNTDSVVQYTTQKVEIN
jgi:hypothetical protein